MNNWERSEEDIAQQVKRWRKKQRKKYFQTHGANRSIDKQARMHRIEFLREVRKGVSLSRKGKPRKQAWGMHIES